MAGSQCKSKYEHMKSQEKHFKIISQNTLYHKNLHIISHTCSANATLHLTKEAQTSKINGK